MIFFLVTLLAVPDFVSPLGLHALSPWSLRLLRIAPRSVWGAILLTLASPSTARSLLQLYSVFEVTVDVVLLISSCLSVILCVVWLVQVHDWFFTQLQHPNCHKVYRKIVRYANIVRLIASKGVLAWKVKSQWLLRFAQAVRLRQRRTGKDYVELDRVYLVQRSPRPTPSPTIATDNQIVDQPETIISHQDYPQYLPSRREGRLGSESSDHGHLVNRSTSEREAQDEARPTASPVTLEQTKHHQVTEPTNAASASGVISAIPEVPAKPPAFVGPASPRPSISDRFQGLKQYRDKTARERGETLEQLQALLDEERTLRTAEEAAPSTTAPTNQSQLPETDNTQEQPLISRLLFPSTNRPRVLFRFRTRVVLVPKPEPLFPVSSSRPRWRNVPTPAPTPEPSTAPAPEHTPQPTAPVLIASRPVVTTTPISQPVVTTEPTVSPEPILAVQLTTPEIVITPPSPVLVPEAPVEDVQVVIDQAIPGLPNMLAPEAIIQEIITVPSVPAAPVVSQLQWVARDLTVSEQGMDDIMLQLEEWHISTPVAVFAAPAVNEQDTTGNAVQSPVSVPVMTTITSSADDPVPSVAPSVEASSLLEPVSACSLDDDVEMEEEDVPIFPVVGPDFNGVRGNSEASSDGDLTMTDNDVAPAVQVDQSKDHDMQDADASHQACMPQESPVVSSDMELCPQHQAPETSIFGGQVDSLAPRAPEQPFWKLAPAFSSGQQAALGFNFSSLPVVQTEVPEHDTTDAPLFQASAPFHFGQQQAAATPSHAQFPETIEVEMGEQTYPDSATVYPVPSPMASQPLPLHLTPIYASSPSPQATINLDMVLVTLAPQIATSAPSPAAPEPKQVVSSTLETDDLLLDPALFEPIDMPLDEAEAQVASPTVEQQPEQAPELESDLNEYRGPAVCDPELWAQLQAYTQNVEQDQRQQEDQRQQMEQQMEQHLVQALQNYARERDAEEACRQGLQNTVTEQDAGEAQQQQESVYLFKRAVEAPEVHQKPPCLSPSFIPNVDEENNNDFLVLSSPAPAPATSHIFVSGSSSAAPVGFEPTLPVGAQAITQEFPQVLTLDEEAFRNEMARMEERCQAGIALTRAELSATRVNTEAVGGYIAEADEPEDGESGESSNRPPPIPIHLRPMAKPKSLLSRATATATATEAATPSVPPAAPLRVAPFADMGSIGEPIPPIGSALPNEEQNAEDKELTREDQMLLGLDVPSDDEDVADEDVARMADAATIQRRGIRPLRNRRNLLQQNNTDN